MKTRLFARGAVALASLALISLAACSDSNEVGAAKLKPIKEGTPVADVYNIVGTGPLTAQYADTIRLDHGFRRSIYMVNGKKVEVLYYREQPGNVAEPLYQDTETPIVAVDGKVEGWGWKAYKKAMTAYNLPANVTDRNPPAPAATKPAEPAPAKKDSAAAAPGPKA